MILDKFDQDILEASGNAKDLIKRFYGVDISLNNAQKRWTGVRMHVKHKQKMPAEHDKGLEEIEIKGDGTRTTKRLIWLSEEDKKKPSRVLDLMGFDPIQWEMIRCNMKRSHWNSITKNNEGEGDLHTLHAYNCEVSVKPIQDVLTTDMMKSVFDDFQSPKLEKISYTCEDGFLLEIPIVDFHLGLLAWAEETGEDYDLKIAEHLYKSTILDIISRAKAYNLKIEKVLFPVGQDFYNSDTVENTTTKGTHLDSDTRWGKLFVKGVDLLVWSIEQLRRIAPVESFHVAGNHDKIMSYCAVVALQAYFRNTENVDITVSPKPRKYSQFGNCLIGFAHGADEGKRIKNMMQVEAPEMWGQTKFREMHLGHLHHESVEEDGGVIYRHIGTMKMTDAWETEKAYVGAIHKVQAFVWDKEKGKVLTIDSIQNISSKNT